MIVRTNAVLLLSGTIEALDHHNAGRVSLCRKGGSTLLVDLGKGQTRTTEICHQDAPASSAVFTISGAELMLGSSSGILRRCDLRKQPYEITELNVKADDDDRTAKVVCITRQPEADKFAVARGSRVFVIDTQGTLFCEIPLAEPASHLHWLNASNPEIGPTLVAVSGPTIYCWTQAACECGPTLDGGATAYTNLASASNTLRIAASSADVNEVYCWNLQDKLHLDEPVKPDLTLKGFEAKVQCMDWNQDGRYLAISVGEECIVWDVPEISNSTADTSDAIVCCGHGTSSKITSIAFQPEGSLLATACDASNMLLFDTKAFRSGGVVAPLATVHLNAGAVTAMKWLSTSELMVGTADGQVICFSVEDALGQSTPSPVAAQPQTLTSCPEDSPLQVDTLPISDKTKEPSQLSVDDATQQPVNPEVASMHHLPAEMQNLKVSTRVPSSSRSPKSVASSPPPPPPPPPPPLRPPPLKIRLSSDAGSSTDEYFAASSRQYQPPSPLSEQASRQSSTSLERGGSSSNYGASSSKGGGRGGSRGTQRSGSVGERSTSTSMQQQQQTGALSPSLMHHIQQLRENPNLHRGESSEPLTGWGLGSPSSGSAIPWVLSPQTATMMPPGHHQYAPAGMTMAGPTGQPIGMQYAAMPYATTMQYPMHMQAMPRGATVAYMPTSPGGSAGGMTQIMTPQGPMAIRTSDAAAMQGAGGGGQWIPAGMHPGAHQGGYVTFAQHPYGAMPALAAMEPHAMPMYAQQPTGGSRSMRQSSNTSGGDRGGGNRASEQHSGGRENPKKPALSSPPSPATAAASARNNSAGTAHPGPPPELTKDPSSSAMSDEANTEKNNNAEKRVSSPSSGSSGQHKKGEDGRGEKRDNASQDEREATPPSNAATPRAEEEVAKEKKNKATQGGTPPSESMPPHLEEEEASYDGVDGSSTSRSRGSRSSGRGGGSNNEQRTAHPAAPQGGGDHIPDAADPTLGTVYIGNLPAEVDEATLGYTCSHFGPVTYIQVIRDKTSRASRGFAFVTFAHPAYATLAMQQLNGQMLYGPFGGQRIRVAPTNHKMKPPAP